MIFNESKPFNTEEVDDILVADPNTEEGLEAMAHEVESLATQEAFNSLSYFDGGAEAANSITESAEFEALMESRKMPKRTFVRLNKQDDLQRREHLACLILAKKNNDSLWKKYVRYRVEERKLRRQIFAKYSNKGKVVARKSQMIHIKNSRKLPSLPKISL